MKPHQICSECAKQQSSNKLTSSVASVLLVDEPRFFQFLCEIHSINEETPRPLQRPKYIKTGTPVYDMVCALVTDKRLFRLFVSYGNRLEASIVSDVSQALFESCNAAVFSLLVEPWSLVTLKDKDRIFRFLRKAGVLYPNEFVSEEAALNLLCRMLRNRVSVGVIDTAFEYWPRCKDSFKPLRAIIGTKNSVVEKKLLLEMLLPYYVSLALREDTKRCMEILNSLSDRVLKGAILSYIAYMQRLHVLKAMEVSTLTKRLPRNLRRYMVETFFTF